MMPEDTTEVLPDREQPPKDGFLKRFRNLRNIGRGAMGEVFLAEDSRLSRRVAIKTVRTVNATDPVLEANLHERFQKEAGAAARISHPNVVTIFDYAIEAGVQYIVMEYVEGRPLSKIISAENPVERLNAVRILISICEGVKAIHQAGIIHRDLKPSNILCGNQDDVIKIMDLGIARLEGSDMTQTGMIIGTLNYMSPEQAQGQRVTRASDIFSIGCIAYELITREKAFPGRSATGVLYRIANEAPLLPTKIDPTLPEFWNDFTTRCLEKNPDKRFRDCDEILAFLAKYVSYDETKTPDDTTITAAVQHARRSAAVNRATEVILEKPWMIGEVYWVSNILTLSMASLTVPYLLIKDFIAALTDQLKQDEEFRFSAISMPLKRPYVFQVFGSWGLTGFGVIAGIVFIELGLNPGPVSDFKEAIQQAKYWLVASECGLFSGWILFLLWLYHTSKRLHQNLVQFRTPNAEYGVEERSMMFGRIYYFIIEGGLVMLAIGIQIPLMYEYLFAALVRRVAGEISAPTPVYLLELSLLPLIAILLVYSAHNYVRYISRLLLLRAFMDKEVGRSWKISFGSSRVFCGFFILIIPFYLHRDELLRGLRFLFQ